MTRKVYAYGRTVPGNCGVGYLSDFEFSSDDVDGYWGGNHNESLDILVTGGAGFMLAGFIKSKVCKAAYERLCALHTLVYQSPVRINLNSRRKFFFCIFDTRD